MTRVFIVVGIRLYREGLVQLLNALDEFTVVGAESTARRAVERIDESAPDVALVDMRISDVHLISSSLAQRTPRVPIVAIGMSDADSDVLACAEIGIAGCVTRESSVEELTAAIRGAAEGELICSPRVAGILIRRLAELAAERHRNGSLAPLTRREREVAALMCEDLSNKEIASRLRIEVATVKNHVHNVLDKLHIHRRSEVVRLFAHSTSRAVGQE